MVIFIQATEIFPTQLRSTGSGFASTVGSMMNILSPYAAYFVSHKNKSFAISLNNFDLYDSFSNLIVGENP